MFNDIYMLSLVHHSRITGDNPPDVSGYGYDFAQLPPNGSGALLWTRPKLLWTLPFSLRTQPQLYLYVLAAKC